MDERYDKDPGPLDAGFAELFPPDEASDLEVAGDNDQEGSREPIAGGVSRPPGISDGPAASQQPAGDVTSPAPGEGAAFAGDGPPLEFSRGLGGQDEPGILGGAGAAQTLTASPGGAEPATGEPPLVPEAIPALAAAPPGDEIRTVTVHAAPPEAEIQALSFPQGRVIAVVNQKGGVGKTTTTINLGAALALEGARVLLADFDPQGALSVGFGLNPNNTETTIYNLLLDRSVSLSDVVKKSTVAGLDLLPSNIDLSAAEIMLVSEVAREQLLKRALADARREYNYILIDCPPSLGLLTVNALTAAHGVIIPLECEYFALRGMALLMDTIEKVQERLNPELEVEGIVATIVDSRTLHGREVMSRVGEAFGDKLFKTVIHKTIRFAEAPVAGEPILTYAPQSNGAQEYRDLAREVIFR